MENPPLGESMKWVCYFLGTPNQQIQVYWWFRKGFFTNKTGELWFSKSWFSQWIYGFSMIFHDFPWFSTNLGLCHPWFFFPSWDFPSFSPEIWGRQPWSLALWGQDCQRCRSKLRQRQQRGNAEELGLPSGAKHPRSNIGCWTLRLEIK